MQLQCFVQDQVELVIDTNDGYAFSTLSGYSRMANVSKSIVSSRLKEYNSSKKAEFVDYASFDATSGSNADGNYKNLRSNNTKSVVLTNVPIQMDGQSRRVTLIPENLVAKWLKIDNPELTDLLLEVGVRTFLHKLAGYKVISTAVQPLDNTQEMFCKMMEMMQQISSENKQLSTTMSELQAKVDELSETKTKYDNIQTNVSFRYDNLYLTLRQYEYEELTQKLLESAQGEYFTVKDWLKDKRIYLDRGAMITFGRLVSDSYKAMVGREPDTKGKSSVRIYFNKDKDLLNMCLRQFGFKAPFFSDSEGRLFNL